MMLQLSVYLPTELEWLRCVRFVTRWLEKRENIQLHLNKRLWASASDAKKFNFEDKRRKKKRKTWKVRRKRGGIDFFCVYSFSQWSEHANEVWCQQLSIYIHNGLDNVVVAFEEISISHRIFFLFSFYLHFYRTATTFMGTMWKFLNISTWLWNISKFSVCFSLSLAIRFQQSGDTARIDVTQTI